MLAASFSSAGSTFVATGVDTAAVVVAGWVRSARNFAFAARNIANSFDAAVNCSVNFAASLEPAPRGSPVAALPPPVLPLTLAARASRSARHVLFGPSAAVVAVVADSFARSALRISVVARDAFDSDVVAAVTVSELAAAASLFSVGAVMHPGIANSTATDKKETVARGVMASTEQEPLPDGKSYLRLHFVATFAGTDIHISIVSLRRVQCVSPK